MSITPFCGRLVRKKPDQTGSYAINGGTPVRVFSDFFRTSRPQNGVMDIGAMEGH